MSGKYKHLKRYHFIGIGGMGMGNLALLMLAKGYQVSGSDVKEGDLTRQLREKGAKIFIGHNIKNIEGADCLVYSSAISASNPEMFEGVRLHLPVLKRAELLAELANKEVAITVAGAHGKTTTSSLASFLLINAGMRPTTAIGGVVHQGYNANLGIGRHFVAEVDESDGSFLYFKPYFSLITNIDFEHVDYYQTWEKIKETYAKFVNRTVDGGVIFACGDDSVLREIVLQSGKRFMSYGFSEENDWVAREITSDVNGSAFDCYLKGNFVGHFSLALSGKHNILNAMAVIALGHELQIDLAVIDSTLKTFNGVKRRFQKKADVGGVLIIDDYGHHPTEVAATLQAARTLDRKRLVTVFQPHRYTRTKFLMDQFADAFRLTDHLILTDIYAASEKPIEGVSAKALLERIQLKDPQQSMYLKKEALVDHLVSFLEPGDLLLTLGAGDIFSIADDVAHRLEQRERVSAQSLSETDMKKFGSVGVIMGGTSSEREVSLKSGKAVTQALIEAGCDVKPLDLNSQDRNFIKEWIKSAGIDVAFIALHGRFGEDGGIQSVLDELDIPYNGCGPAASYAAFNKAIAQKKFENESLRVPRTMIVNAGDELNSDLAQKALGGFPLVVKPACEGSSIGVSLVKDHDELTGAVHKAKEYGKEILVQQYVKGRELTVGILQDVALPIVEVRTTQVFFDYNAKYQDQSTEYVVPANLAVEVTQRVQQDALKAFKALGCEGFGRVDFILDAKGTPYLLEINTIPGFTSTSLLPKAAAMAGLDFQKLCLTLIEKAYGKKKKNIQVSKN